MCDGETKIKRKKSPSRARDHYMDSLL